MIATLDALSNTHSTPNGQPHPLAASLSPEQVTENVRVLAASFAQQRRERQRRRALDPADFDRLRDAGFLLCAVPVEYGGLWEGGPRSMRFLANVLRTLAHGDASVALVASMHPAVLSAMSVLDRPVAPEPYRAAWESQRRWIFDLVVRDGVQWGTINSEPGSGGDIAQTRAIARRTDADGLYRVSGLKHFGSGSGIAGYWMTTAVPEGETDPDIFIMDLRGVPWDGSAGVKLVAEWDGHGMTATQSHMLRFDDFPATRLAWPSSSRNQKGFGGIGSGVTVPGTPFVAVIVGIVEVAMDTARAQLAPRKKSLRAFEQVEWAKADVDAWLIQQAYEEMLRAGEQERDILRTGRIAKAAIAELAESVLNRICRVIGGGAYSRNTPYGFWLEDVRALGFLRPPWGLAYDNLFAGSLPDTA